MSVRRLADPAIQPKSFAFTVENLDWAKGEIAKYPEGRQSSAIIALLWRAQEQAGGWLPQKAIEHVADLLGMPKIRALEVATFYTMFNLSPVGRFHVQLCGTTPCVLRGADKLIKLCHDRIGEQLEVTSDGKLSWIEVECLGACVNAPVAQITCVNPAGAQANYDYYEDLTLESFTKILDDLLAGKAVTPGPQVARQLSAPTGGPTTLTDPALYANGKGGQTHGQALSDADAKKPGEPANVREAAVPKSPIGDSSANRRS
jgi:NADH-quinone oxidoreductase subunit E